MMPLPALVCVRACVRVCVKYRVIIEFGVAKLDKIAEQYSELDYAVLVQLFKFQS